MNSVGVPESNQTTIDAIRLQRALNAAELGSWQYDPVRRIFSWDARCRAIFGTLENETRLEEFVTWVYPDDMERVWAACHGAIDSAEPTRSATEFRLTRGDGEVRWVKTSGLAYFEFDGNSREPQIVAVVGTVADITEYKEREERERLLMREVSHRAKNMLCVVNAIAHQTAAESPEDFLDRFSGRIDALSANQDLLVSNDWQGVGLKDLVHAQLAHFDTPNSSRIVVYGPELVLRPAAAQAIGLALHELATNAGKYGALSTDAGRIDVWWEADSDTFTMSWIERDGPPVSAAGRRGFGSTVLESMTERSVGGTVNLHYASSGVTWHLACPAANALLR
jgi:PAS domain S-box-containing protein